MKHSIGALSARLYADGVIALRQVPGVLRRPSAARSPLSDVANSKSDIDNPEYGMKPGRDGPKPGWGVLARETRFGNRAKRTLLEYGAIIDEIYKPGEALFVTLTLPGTGDKQYRALAEWSSYVVHRCTQWWRDTASEPHYGWCWEWQKRGALHLHAVVASHDAVGLDRILLEWKEFCRGLLQEVSTRAGVNLFENTETGINHWDSDCIRMDAQVVAKSAARYLAKYLGKRKEPGHAVSFHSPARWWRVCNRSLTEIRARRRSWCAESAEPDMVAEAHAEVVAAVVASGAKVVAFANKVFSDCFTVMVLAESPREGRRVWRAMSHHFQVWRTTRGGAPPPVPAGG